MPNTNTLDYEQQLDMEAEILRHIWYEGKSTPQLLVNALQYEWPLVYECVADLVERDCIFRFLESPEDKNSSIYCLTKRVKRKLQKALEGYDRYRLKVFWDSFKRENVVWLTQTIQH